MKIKIQNTHHFFIYITVWNRRNRLSADSVQDIMMIYENERIENEDEDSYEDDENDDDDKDDCNEENQ